MSICYFIFLNILDFYSKICLVLSQNKSNDFMTFTYRKDFYVKQNHSVHNYDHFFLVLMKKTLPVTLFFVSVKTNQKFYNSKQNLKKCVTSKNIHFKSICTSKSIKLLYKYIKSIHNILKQYMVYFVLIKWFCFETTMFLRLIMGVLRPLKYNWVIFFYNL